MTKKPEIDLEAIRRTPARTLLNMPHEQLDRFIEEAERASVDAAIVLNWLVSIKTEKSINERKGGQDD